MAKERRDSKKRILNKGEYQNEDGRYMYKYKDIDGKPRFVYSWTLTKTDRTPKGKQVGKCLRDLEKEIEEKLAHGISTYSANTETLNACFDRYMQRKHKLKESTRTTYIENYNRYVRNTIGTRLIADIRYSDIYSFYDSLICEEDLMPSTVKNIQIVLNPVFRIAVRDHLIRDNPCTGVITEICREHGWTPTKRHALTREQQTAFTNYIKDHYRYYRWYTLIVFLLGTGCRISEALGLTWSDCDFENGVIHIDHAIAVRRCKKEDMPGGSPFYITSPKSKAGIRDIPMFSTVRRILMEERKNHFKNGFGSASIGEYSGFIFVNWNGEPLYPAAINEVIYNIIKAYNRDETQHAKEENRPAVLLPRFSAHTLRHTFCTRICETETNIKVIQEVMGHSNIAITMDVYTDATMEQKKTSFEKIEDKMMIC